MTRQIKTLASLAALMGTAALLVADSAERICGSYQGFEATFDFTTDCPVETPAGRVVFVIADRLVPRDDSGTVLDWELAGQATEDIGLDFETQARAGDLPVSDVDIDWNDEDCAVEGSEGSIHTISFTLGRSDEDDGVRCRGWGGAMNGNQNLSCSADGQPICSIQFFTVN